MSDTIEISAGETSVMPIYVERRIGDGPWLPVDLTGVVSFEMFCQDRAGVTLMICSIANGRIVVTDAEAGLLTMTMEPDMFADVVKPTVHYYINKLVEAGGRISICGRGQVRITPGPTV